MNLHGIIKVAVLFYRLDWLEGNYNNLALFIIFSYFHSPQGVQLIVYTVQADHMQRHIQGGGYGGSPRPCISKIYGFLGVLGSSGWWAPPPLKRKNRLSPFSTNKYLFYYVNNFETSDGNLGIPFRGLLIIFFLLLFLSIFLYITYLSSIYLYLFIYIYLNLSVNLSILIWIYPILGMSWISWNTGLRWPT